MKKYTIEGIVTKVTESEYVLFCDDGTFRNIPLTKVDMPMMGERKTYTTKAQNPPFRIVSTVAMVAILFIAFLSYGVFQNHSETHYIAAIDINPSIEAHLDEDLNVVKLSSLNTDGKQIVDSIDSEGVDFYQLVDLIVSESISKGYLTTDEKGSIETTIVKVTNDSIPPSERDLKEVIQTQLQRKNIVADIQVFNEKKEFYDQSERADVSMNKYRHYQTLRGKGLLQDIEEVKEKSIRQLQDMIDEEVKKVPVEAEQGKGDSRENAKSNPGSHQNQSQSTINPKGDQPDHKPALDNKQEPSDNKDGQQKDRKPSNKSSSPENETSSNQRSSEAPPTRDQNESSRDNEASQKAEIGDSQTNSNDNTQPKNETSIESQLDTETNVEKKDESASKGETGPEKENLDSKHNGENENKPSSSSKP